MIPTATLAVVPMQRLELAKSRLAGRLTHDERRDLVITLLAHVLDALHSANLVDAVLVVTPDQEVATRARSSGAEALPQHVSEPGLNPAIRLVQAEAIRRGAGSLLVVLGDLPLLNGEEVDALIEMASEQAGITAAPDRHGSGTNALLLRPPDAIEPGFGVDSLRRHREAAARRGIALREHRSPGFAFDVDTADDLAALEMLRWSRRA